MSSTAHFYDLAKTRFGTAAMVWSEEKQGPRITRVLLPAPEETIKRQVSMIFPAAARKSCAIIAKFAQDLQAFTEGKAITFDMSALDMSRVPPFHKKVLRALARIAKGKVSTYGTIAAKTGAPRGYRAAGQGCANNPFPIVFPCHRVIRSDRSLGGFGGGLKLKKALLEMEGVQFDSTGKVKPEYIV